MLKKPLTIQITTKQIDLLIPDPAALIPHTMAAANQ